MTDRSYSRPWYSISNVVLLIDSDLVIVAGPQNGSKCLRLRLALRASPSEGGLKKLTLSPSLYRMVDRPAAFSFAAVSALVSWFTLLMVVWNDRADVAIADKSSGSMSLVSVGSVASMESVIERGFIPCSASKGVMFVVVEGVLFQTHAITGRYS